VEGLRDDHGVDARVRQRNRLGDRIERLCGRRRAPEQLAHRRHGLERDHARAAAGELARELARAGAELEQRAPRCGARDREDRLDRAGRVARAAALVGTRGPFEADRGRGVDVAPHASRSGTGRPGSSSIAR
jgi:hypothetical protein